MTTLPGRWPKEVHRKVKEQSVEPGSGRGDGVNRKRHFCKGDTGCLV